MKNRIASCLPVVSLLALMPALPAGTVNRQALQKQDIVLLERVEDTARDAVATTERLDSYNRVPNEYSRECHLYQLEALKEEINGMTRDLDRVASTRDGLDDADRKAVTRVVIAAVELAQSANAAILKADQVEATPALNPEYRKLTAECYREAGELVKLLEAGIVELK